MRHSSSTAIAHSRPLTEAIKADLPPAISLPLTGQYLIEASAGTGKTWTLTGVLLRLLVEAGHPCDKIIATTFTRSAAAEMRQRVRERLQDFARLLRLVPENLLPIVKRTKQLNRAKRRLKRHLKHHARRYGLQSAVRDPINVYLLDRLATQTLSQSSRFQQPTIETASISQLGDSNTDNTPTSTPPLDVRLALQRTQTALSQLDRLFISTLDSLCQKWLREYSSETGFSSDVQISNDIKPVIMGMIHDELRAFWAGLYQHEPELYRIMQHHGKLLSAEDFYPAVEKALNFYSTPIDPVMPSKIDLTALSQLMQAIAEYNDPNFAVYFNKAYRDEQGFTKGGILTTRLEFFQAMQQVFRGGDIAVLLGLEKNHKSIYELLQAVTSLKTTGRGFNGKHEAQQAQFLGFTVIDDMVTLFAQLQQLTEHIDQINRYFTQFISRHVREQLPNVLEAQQLTTFTLQLARLNQALADQQGAGLARYIRHQYPVALIDESQDINTEQALLIERIYLAKNPAKSSSSTSDNTSSPADNSFLLLVGDPKQAIYGFRGGDVSNYTTLKKLISTQPLALNENRRSVLSLIEALNHWYGVASPTPTPAGEPVNAASPNYLGEGIAYQPMTATRKHPALVPQLDEPVTSLPALYQLAVPVANDKQDTEDAASEPLDSDDAVTMAILALMNSGTDPDHPPLMLKGKALQLGDICVLATRHRQLDTLERKLNRAGIDTLRGGNQSVFGEQMSADLLSLMTAILSPHNIAKLKTVLLSSFFQFTLVQANALLDSEPADDTDLSSMSHVLNAIQTCLSTANEYWQKDGFLVAIQWLLNESMVLPHDSLETMPTGKGLNFWQRLARHPLGERLLIDLRHILDLISEQTANQMMGEYQLVDWLATLNYRQPKEDWAVQQRLPSETGVKLMTIHQSKGLEFAIVFILGMDDKVEVRNAAAPLFLYQVPNPQNPLKSRRLTPRPNEAHPEGHKDYQAGELQALFEEKLRLLYVALTRARERVYIVTQARSRARSNTALTAFIKDNKSFALRDDLLAHIPSIDANSLSKYKQTHYQKPKQDDELSAEDIQQLKHNAQLTYQQNIAQIQQATFQGWANTSFTALSRLFQREQHALAVHLPDYDEWDDVEDEAIDDAFTLDTVVNPARQPAGTSLKPSDNNVQNPTNPHDTIDLAITDKIAPNQPPVMMPSEPADLMISDDWEAIPPWQMDSVPYESLSEPFEPWQVEPFEQTLDPHFVGYDEPYGEELFPEPTELNFDVDYANFLNSVGQGGVPTFSNESQLMRFTFEKGTGAGTFLHKVLEDLANAPADDHQGSIGEDGIWRPSARWGVIIDRALRQQQLPALYFSTLTASQEGFQLSHAQSDEPLQPHYLALSGWLNEVIHTPFGATGQRPIDIKAQQKSAEMGFNMRLTHSLSLESLNQLFSDYQIPLNLHTEAQMQAMWRYLRGEIDLVYQHDNRYYIVDYKSNFLGDSFAAYHKDALAEAMNAHGYWLQASIYQVALHRFLQLRLPNYDPTHQLGAVEYAFIRGMSPEFADYGRLVWQPPLDFILALDKLFGNPTLDG